jgi:hypothetical protein
LRLADLRLSDIEMEIYRDRDDYRRLHVSDLFNNRLGDKIGQTVLVAHRREFLTEDEAVICLDHVWNEINTKGTYIDARTYFRHQYDAIVRIHSKDQRERFGTHFKAVFPDWMSIAGHLWEELINMRQQRIYYTMHSCPNMDRWWQLEKRRRVIPRHYAACHILTDTDYHPDKLVNYNNMVDSIKAVAEFIPIVIVGIPVNGQVVHTNVFDLSHSGFTIDQSIAIVNDCDVFFGGDTGITHVAAALKKHVIQVFPGDERFHCANYDARPCIPDYRYRRVFLQKDGTFDVSLFVRHIKDSAIIVSDGAIR